VTTIEDRSKSIADISDRLIQKHPSVQPDAIARTVELTYCQFDGRPIRDFVPVLVERAVNEDLRAITTQPRTSTPTAEHTSCPAEDATVDIDVHAPAKFDRYKQASIAHQTLQGARWKLREATAETQSQAQATEAALEISATELNSARADYLRDPQD
jgi:hypothetical protein